MCGLEELKDVWYLKLIWLSLMRLESAIAPNHTPKWSSGVEFFFAHLYFVKLQSDTKCTPTAYMNILRSACGVFKRHGIYAPNQTSQMHSNLQIS